MGFSCFFLLTLSAFLSALVKNFCSRSIRTVIRIDLDKHPINILRRDIQIELDPLTVIQLYLVIYPGIDGILSSCENSDEQDSDTDLSGNWSTSIR